MYLSHHFNNSIWSLTAKLSLIILLWAGYANIAHALDNDPDHHHEHQCELYAALQTAISKTPYTVPLIDLDETDYVQPALIKPRKTLAQYCARDPPSIASKNIYELQNFLEN